MMARLDVGANLWAIASIKARYFRYMDLKQWKNMRALFTDDAIFDHPTIGRFNDPSAAIDSVAALLVNEFWTNHESGIPDIELTSTDTAKGVFAMSSTSRAPGQKEFARTFGYYYDEFRRVDGVWRITTMKLISSYRDF
jgi:hypothetical protein